jgi:molybdopterin converting factor subunit 1
MPVSVRTLFFAAYRDLLGTSELRVDLEGEPTVENLVRSLRARGAPFDALPPRPAVAVNHTYVDSSERLEPNDEVAFIPPVAGG